ncbi:MAG TPA: hypothetical protein VIE89_01970 [Candidatus Binatia bacterium]
MGFYAYKSDVGCSLFESSRYGVENSCLDSDGLEDVAGEGHIAQFNGGSDWAGFWIETMRELAPSLLKSSYVTEKMLEKFHAHYQDRHHWTSLIAFTANWGRKPA